MHWFYMLLLSIAGVAGVILIGGILTLIWEAIAILREERRQRRERQQQHNQRVSDGRSH